MFPHGIFESKMVKLFLKPIAKSTSRVKGSLLSLLFSGTGSGECCFSSASDGGREGPGFSYGLNSALAVKGVIIQDKVYRNLTPAELRQRGANISGSFSGLSLHVRGSVLGGASEISKQQFSKLLKQVTTHLSSVSDIYVHDGAIASSSKCGTKVRVISDTPTAILSLSNVLWEVSSRAISHDSCPLTVYITTSVSEGLMDAVGLRTQANKGLIAADIERASLILCDKAFLDINATKKALSILSEPIICARGGLPLPARLLESGDSVILLFAPENTIESCKDHLVSGDTGVILSPMDAAPYFRTKIFAHPSLFKLPVAVIIASSDSTGTIPSISKLSPGQAAYHLLAGYHNGKFVPAYSNSPSFVNALELAKAFLSKLKDNQISSFLVNVNEGGKCITGKDFLTLAQSALLNNIPPFQSQGTELARTYQSFLSTKFHEIPKEFSF